MTEQITSLGSRETQSASLNTLRIMGKKTLDNKEKTTFKHASEIVPHFSPFGITLTQQTTEYVEECDPMHTLDPKQLSSLPGIQALEKLLIEQASWLEESRYRADTE